MATPTWLLSNNSKAIILKSILNDINEITYYDEIFDIIDKFTFTTRINYLTKASLVIFMFLQSKSIPILIEDIIIYCNCRKITFISLLAKNKIMVPSSSASMQYVINVLGRVYETFKKHITLEYATIHKNVIALYNSWYYYNRSPLTSILVLCFYNNVKNISTILKARYPTITKYMINKEIEKISKVLKEKPSSSIFADKAAKSMEESKISEKKKKKQHRKCLQSQEGLTLKELKYQEKEQKVDKAILLYSTRETNEQNYATDYEGILIEGMVKKGYSKEMIMNLTKKGLEYYRE